MEDLIKQGLAQAPALTVLVILVYLFLAYLKSAQSTLKDLFNSSQAFIREMHQEHLDARVQSRDAIHANTEALSRNTVAMTEMKDSVARQLASH